MTNLTPAQIEQFESTFRYFDKDEKNTLNLSEMAAALASLGIVYGVGLYLSAQSCPDNSRQRTRTLISSSINCFKNMVPSPSKLSLTSWYVPLVRILNVEVGFHPVQVEITEDQTSPDQLREAFQGAANNKVRLWSATPWQVTDSELGCIAHLQPYVTELDLRLAHIPTGAVDYLREVMPANENDAGEREYDYDAWLGSVFEY